MKVIAYDRFKPGVTMDTIRPLLAEEVGLDEDESAKLQWAAYRRNLWLIGAGASALVAGAVLVAAMRVRHTPRRR